MRASSHLRSSRCHLPAVMDHLLSAPASSLHAELAVPTPRTQAQSQQPGSFNTRSQLTWVARMCSKPTQLLEMGPAHRGGGHAQGLDQALVLLLCMLRLCLRSPGGCFCLSSSSARNL